MKYFVSGEPENSVIEANTILDAAKKYVVENESDVPEDRITVHEGWYAFVKAHGSPMSPEGFGHPIVCTVWHLTEKEASLSLDELEDLLGEEDGFSGEKMEFTWYGDGYDIEDPIGPRADLIKMHDY